MYAVSYICTLLKTDSIQKNIFLYATVLLLTIFRHIPAEKWLKAILSNHLPWVTIVNSFGSLVDHLG